MCRNGSEEVTVFAAAADLDAAGEVFEALLHETGAPVTAQWWWVRAWFDTHPHWQPMCVAVQSDGTVVGGAVLAVRRRGPVAEIVPAGFGQSDYPYLASVPDQADSVARALASHLAGLRRPWRMLLYEIFEEDQVFAALSTRLRNVEVFPGVGSPVIDLPGFDPSVGVGGSARRRTRLSWNRLAADNKKAEFTVVRSPDELEAVLDELQMLHVARDHAVRGGSDLDMPEQAAFWRAALRGAAAQGCLETVLVRIDGDLAGHLIGFCDGPAYRVWDTRFEPRFSRYSPGHLMREEVLNRLTRDGRFELFDWMRGVEDYKLQSATRVLATLRMRAWSHSWLARAERAARRVADRRRDEEAGNDA